MSKDLVEKVARALYVDARPEGWEKTKAGDLWDSETVVKDKAIKAAQEVLKELGLAEVECEYCDDGLYCDGGYMTCPTCNGKGTLPSKNWVVPREPSEVMVNRALNTDYKVNPSSHPFISKYKIMMQAHEESNDE